MNIRVEIGNFLRGKGPIGILRFSQRLLLELFTSRTTITPPILDPVNFHTDFSLLFELYDFDWKISVVLFRSEDHEDEEEGRALMAETQRDGAPDNAQDENAKRDWRRQIRLLTLSFGISGLYVSPVLS